MSHLEERVRADIVRWGLDGTSIAAAALDVVDRLSSEYTSATSAAMLHQRLQTYLAEMRAMAPPEVAHDEIDEVEEQRKARRLAAGMQ